MIQKSGRVLLVIAVLSLVVGVVLMAGVVKSDEGSGLIDLMKKVVNDEFENKYVNSGPLEKGDVKVNYDGYLTIIGDNDKAIKNLFDKIELGDGKNGEEQIAELVKSLDDDQIGEISKVLKKDDKNSEKIRVLLEERVNKEKGEGSEFDGEGLAHAEFTKEGDKWGYRFGNLEEGNFVSLEEMAKHDSVKYDSEKKILTLGVGDRSYQLGVRDEIVKGIGSELGNSDEGIVIVKKKDGSFVRVNVGKDGIHTIIEVNGHKGDKMEKGESIQIGEHSDSNGFQNIVSVDRTEGVKKDVVLELIPLGEDNLGGYYAVGRFNDKKMEVGADMLTRILTYEKELSPQQIKQISEAKSPEGMPGYDSEFKGPQALTYKLSAYQDPETREIYPPGKEFTRVIKGTPGNCATGSCGTPDQTVRFTVEELAAQGKLKQIDTYSGVVSNSKLTGDNQLVIRSLGETPYVFVSDVTITPDPKNQNVKVPIGGVYDPLNGKSPIIFTKTEVRGTRVKPNTSIGPGGTPNVGPLGTQDDLGQGEGQGQGGGSGGGGGGGEGGGMMEQLMAAMQKFGEQLAGAAGGGGEKGGGGEQPPSGPAGQYAGEPVNVEQVACAVTEEGMENCPDGNCQENCKNAIFTYSKDITYEGGPKIQTG